jgi:hypothetical protein
MPSNIIPFPAVAVHGQRDQALAIFDHALAIFAKYVELERQARSPSTPAARRGRLVTILAEIGDVLTREARS